MTSSQSWILASGRVITASRILFRTTVSAYVLVPALTCAPFAIVILPVVTTGKLVPRSIRLNLLKNCWSPFHRHHFNAACVLYASIDRIFNTGFAMKYTQQKGNRCIVNAAATGENYVLMVYLRTGGNTTGRSYWKTSSLSCSIDSRIICQPQLLDTHRGIGQNMHWLAATLFPIQRKRFAINQSHHNAWLNQQWGFHEYSW